MPALIFLVIATAGGNLFGFLSQLAYNSGILSKFANINRLVSEECRKRGNETIARRREISFFPDSWP